MRREAPNQSSPVVEEEDADLQVCREIFQKGNDTLSPAPAGRLDGGREIIEFHDGIDSITILGEVFGQKQPSRLVRIVLKNPNPSTGDPGERAGLDALDLEYLRRKGAFTLPPCETRDTLLGLYFQCIYPYAPIIDRVEFMRNYKKGQFSLFLLQAMFANVAPFASSALLLEAGFPDRLTAQRSFFLRAQLLYDLGYERGQLPLLQGSILLGSLCPSFASGKDFRFWLTNAIRLATQMGLHRNHIARDLDPATARLFRRIWWVLYNRDIWLAASGQNNVRKIPDAGWDTASLTEADWEEDGIPEPFKDILPLVSRLQKMYFVENCKLSRISGQFIRTFRTPGLVPSEEACREVEKSLLDWRRSLPAELFPEGVHHWTVENVWILLLMAMSYRLECILYRTLGKHPTADAASIQRAAQRQQNAMFELDTVIERIMQNQVAQFCPLSLSVKALMLQPDCALTMDSTNCVSTLLAMHIETALSPTLSTNQKCIIRTRIHTGLSFMRETCEYWCSLKWTLRMFEVVVSRMGLSLTVADDLVPDLNSINPFDSTDGSDFPLRDDDLFDARGEDGFLDDLTDLNGDWLQDLLGSRV